MDPTLFRDTKVSRGLHYHYYHFPQKDSSKPTLLLCHGFPSSPRDWRFVTAYFQERGYGIIVPDMLGYGGTDKPTDPAAYIGSALAKDLVDILDAEKVDKVIAIGHDWGSRLVSRLSSYFPERVIGYAFFTVAFVPPNPGFDYEQSLAAERKVVGYEVKGYWQFFCEDDAEKLIFDHWDSFFSILFPHDPAIWKTKLAPLGAARYTILSGYSAPLPTYITEEDKAIITNTLRQNGLAGPLCWYKVQLNGLSAEDDKNVPLLRYIPPASSPIFFGAALQDAIAIPALGEALRGPKFKDHKVTIKEYNSDHWVILSHWDQINRDLDEWIGSFA